MVLFNKKVTDIVENNDSIEVFLALAFRKKGDTVISADGVYSTVREKDKGACEQARARHHRRNRENG